jgi:hypothetical protein
VTHGIGQSLSKRIYVFIISIESAKIIFGTLYVNLILKELRRVSQALRKDSEYIVRDPN